MTRPDAAALFAALEATWPAARVIPHGPWTLREGQGGGKRVSAATAGPGAGPADIASAETGMEAMGQTPLFMIRPGEEALDAALAARGYRIVDPVMLYLTALDGTQPAAAPMTTFPIWPPLAIMIETWNDTGIDAARIAVMERACAPRTAVMARVRDRVSGCAFVAVDGDIAMLHALETLPGFRRQGSANNMLRRAAAWSRDQGANWLSLAVTTANAPARALYASFGMEVVGEYHYRMK